MLRTTIVIEVMRRCFPSEREVPGCHPKHDGQEQPEVEGHSDKHERVPERGLHEMQSRLDEVIPRKIELPKIK